MFDPRQLVKRYLTWTFVLILFLLISGIAVAGEKVLREKIRPISPAETAGQYCYVKVVIKQKDDDTIVKEEIMECADGRGTYDGPNYWELFAQFYYNDVSAPEYCRYYSRNKHAFKTPGKVCLSEYGEWEVK